jgi:hypothetical protein
MPWSKSETKVVARTKFRNASLEARLDKDDVLQIKCRPVFEKELKKYLKAIARTARRMVNEQHKEYSRRHIFGYSRLERSIHPSEIKKIHAHRIGGTVTAGSRLAPYARFVHEGTRPHRIDAKPPKNYLAFIWKNRVGRVVIKEQAYKLVNRDAIPIPGEFNTTWGIGKIADRRVVVDTVLHPGYRGDPFLNRAARVIVKKVGGNINSNLPVIGHGNIPFAGPRNRA